MKFEVLEDCTLAVKKGSIVICDEFQVRYAQKFLKAIQEHEKEVKEPKENKKKKGE